MSQAAENIANMSVGASTATALMLFVEQHASFFSIAISFSGLVLAAFFYAINYRLNKKKALEQKERDDIQIKILEQRLNQENKNDGNSS